MRQKSFINDQATLYLVATPIGNLDDMSFRAVKTLQEVDVIYCEDTRVSSKLLHHFDISKSLKTYHDFNKVAQSKEIIEDLSNHKNVALISDAGYPLISDPGYYVIREVIKENYNVVNIPGANALLSALTVSGIAPHPFLFYGFLDSKESKRKKELASLQEYPQTLIFYESPHRIQKTIQNMYEVLGKRELVVARELTKKFEEIIRGTTESLLDLEPLKGEIVVVCSGYIPTNDTSMTILEEIEDYISQGMSSKEAIKSVAKNRSLQKNIVYQEYINKDLK